MKRHLLLTIIIFTIILIPTIFAGCSNLSIEVDDLDDMELDEDDDDSGTITIINDYDETFNITDIELEYEDDDQEDYLTADVPEEPEEVGDDDDEDFDIDFTSESVDDDQTIDLTIKITGYFDDDEDNDTCTEEANFSIKVKDAENDEEEYDDLDECDDIELDNLDFSMPSDSTKTKTISITNDNEDYDFTIDDIIIENDDYIEADITDDPESVDADDDDEIEIEFESDEINSDKTRNLTITVAGYFEDDEEEMCKQTADIEIEITDNYDGDEPDCDNLEIANIEIYLETGQIKSQTIEMINNSNDDFEINNASLNTSSYVSTRLSSVPDIINAEDSEYMDLRFTAGNTEMNNIPLTLYIKGNFDGDDCTKRTDIYISVGDTEEEQTAPPINNNTQNTNNNSQNTTTEQTVPANLEQVYVLPNNQQTINNTIISGFNYKILDNSGQDVTNTQLSPDQSYTIKFTINTTGDVPIFKNQTQVSPAISFRILGIFESTSTVLYTNYGYSLTTMTQSGNSFSESYTLTPTIFEQIKSGSTQLSSNSSNIQFAVEKSTTLLLDQEIGNDKIMTFTSSIYPLKISYAGSILNSNLKEFSVVLTENKMQSSKVVGEVTIKTINGTPYFVFQYKQAKKFLWIISMGETIVNKKLKAI